MDVNELQELFARMIGFRTNRFHPLVWILGEPEIGENVSIGGMTEINATSARLVIGDGSDIASFVSINCADSHKRCVGLADHIERRDIMIGDHVFVGSHCFVKGGAQIGHHSVIAAGTVVGGTKIPPYSLVAGNAMGRRQIPVVAVNLGKLGFLANMLAEELPSVLDDFAAGRFSVIEHLMFECTVQRDGKKFAQTTRTQRSRHSCRQPVQSDRHRSLC